MKMATFRMCSCVRNLCLQNLSSKTNVTGERLLWRSFCATAESKDSKSTEEASAVSKVEEELKTENEQLSKKLFETEDKYKRSLAEMENVRRRMQKQVDDQKLYGIQGFCKDLLEVADVLGKATDAVPTDELKATNPHLCSLHDGLVMTNTQLTKVFTKHGLLQILPNDGEKFDPNIHEALFQQPLVEGKEAGTVATITKVGYKLHDRTLRPALVGVFK